MFSGNQKEGARELSAETFIGPSVKLEGTFAAEGDIVVEGVLVGSLATRGDVRVGAQALIDAQVTAENAFIAGKVKGNIAVNGTLKLAATAQVSGDIKTGLISIEEGAVVHGKIAMPKDRHQKVGRREDAEHQESRKEKIESEGKK